MKSKIALIVTALAIANIGLLAQNNPAPSASPAAQASPAPVKLTADQAVDFALLHNVGLMTENLKTAMKQRDSDFAWNKLMPTVGVSMTLAHPNATQTAIIPVGMSLAQITLPDNVWSLGANLSVQWSFAVATIHSINQTGIDFANAKISQETARRKLERDVRKTFNQLLAIQESLKLTERQIINAETRYKQALSSYNAGLTSNLQVLQAQVNWQNKKPALEDQQLNLRQAMMAFAMSLGLDVQTPISLDGSIKTDVDPASLDSQQFIMQRIDQRLDMKAMQGNIDALENTIRLQESLRLPSLVLSYSADPSINTDFSGSGNYYTDPFNLDKWKQRSGVFAVMLRWQLDSLIPGFQTATAIDNLKDQEAQLKLGLDQTRTGAIIEIINLVNRIKKSSLSLETLALNVELAQKAYKQTDDAYKAGNQTLIDVQDADVQQQAALFQVLNEQLTLANNMLDLEYALNANKGEFLKGGKS